MPPKLVAHPKFDHLDERALKTLERELERSVATFNLDFPCNDSSEGVTDFREWSFFQRKNKTGRIVNNAHSSGWSEATVERINDHVLYDVENLAKSDEGRKKWQLREEKLLRDRRAKAQLARWYKTKYPEKSKSPMKGSERATKGGSIGDTVSREPSIIASSMTGSVEGLAHRQTSISIASSRSRSTARSIGSHAKTPSRNVVGSVTVNRSSSHSQSRSPNRHHQRVVISAKPTESKASLDQVPVSKKPSSTVVDADDTNNDNIYHANDDNHEIHEILSS